MKKLILAILVLMVSCLCVPAPVPPAQSSASATPPAAYQITSNLPVGESTFTVSPSAVESTGFTQITFETTTPVEQIHVTVNPVTSPPSYTPGYYYHGANINVQNYPGYVGLHFGVPIVWVNAHGGKHAVHLAHAKAPSPQDDDDWDVLETTLTGETETEYTYSAKAKDFSVYAIIAIEEVVDEPEVPASTNEFPYYLVIIGVAVLICAAYFVLVKKK